MLTSRKRRSQQEPRLLSAYAKEKNMMQAYKDGKDLYATIAMGVYHNNYWDNMEHHEDGTANPEGAKRRSNMKSVLLGILYGRGVASIAEQIHSSVEEAKKIVDDFYKAFPQIKDFTESSKALGHQNGYVEDFWGRRRHLPNILLPKYEVKPAPNANASTFNPILECENRVDPELVKKYLTLTEKIKSRKDYEDIQKRGLLEGVEVISNTMKIAEAERQCVNSRIQGSAASMSKQALAAIYNDPEMRKYDFHASIMVHDEIIGECKEEYAEQAAERLSYLMRTCVEKDVPMVFKCDATITKAWYEDQRAYELKEIYDDFCKTMSSEEAYNKLLEEECPELSLEEVQHLFATYC